MPPEVLASYAEAETYCGEELVSVSVGEALLLGISEALMLYTSECGENSVIIDVDNKDADIIITDFSGSDIEVCQNPQMSLPLFSQAYSIGYNLGDTQGIALNAETVIGIFEGKITSWNSPQIVDTNLGIELPNTEIVIKQIGEPPMGIDDFFSWMKRMGGTDSITITENAVILDSFLDIAQEILLQEGAIGLIPVPVAFDNALSLIEIENEEGLIIYNDASAFASGATQVSWVEEGNTIEAVHDTTKEIPLDPGSEVIVDPYQGLGWSYLQVCGDGNLNLSTSAVARFLFRQDAQGSLDIYGYTPLYEPLRLEAAEIAGRLLPQPEIPQ
jgi:ABC-type phosphate transport system substrate-binding protein